MRYQLGHSPYLTLEHECIQTDEGTTVCKDIYRSYDTPLLVIGPDHTVLFADYRKYSAVTSRHQLTLQHLHTEYRLPAKRERVVYEYSLHADGRNAWGDLYSPRYRAKDNPYDPWHECYPGEAWDWDTAYSQLYDYAASKYGVYNEQNVHDNFVGTL